MRHLSLGQGHFLPQGDPHRARGVAVLGQTLARELFGQHQAVGEWVRIGQWRFRVMGVLASSGQSLGETLDDLAIIPVASAQALFNSPGLFRILAETRDREALTRAQTAVRAIIRERHEGEDDVTVITQDAVLATFDKVLKALTLAVAGIGAISLAVAGVLIMNVMLVSVAQRTPEVGLLKALGAARGQVRALFLTEALLLAGGGTCRAGPGLRAPCICSTAGSRPSGWWSRSGHRWRRRRSPWAPGSFSGSCRPCGRRGWTRCSADRALIAQADSCAPTTLPLTPSAPCAPSAGVAC